MQQRLGIVGCGAVVELSHLPALQKLRVKVSALIDPSPERRRSVARLLGTDLVEAANMEEAVEAFDIAIVAAPHMFHEPICRALLAAGKSVLVEKPIAVTAQSCAAINETARQNGARIAVGLMRRQSKASIWLKDALVAGAFGKLDRFVIREGYEFGWPVTTDSLWRREKSGGGVLMDTGAHTMDQVVWWFGEPDNIEYFDDSDGGVEADCLIRMRWKNGLQGEVELSRTRRLSNAATLFSERGRLSLATLGNDITGDKAMLRYSSPRVGKPVFRAQSVLNLFTEQFGAFLAYTGGAVANVVTGEEGARSVSLIERCYATRQRLELPWLLYTGEAA